jgi:hypothetical protein
LPQVRGCRGARGAEVAVLRRRLGNGDAGRNQLPVHLSDTEPCKRLVILT